MYQNIRLCLLTTALMISASNSNGMDINLGPIGHLCDTCGGGVIGGLPIVGPSLNELVSQAGAPALEQWIIQSRNTAINGTAPIPPMIRQMLTGYASEDSMNKARFKVEDNGFLNLSRVIEQAGQASAVTLIDVIVFRDTASANNPAIWAHELTHVDQYSRWGAHDFAISYIRDHGTVEQPAYDKQYRYAAWAQSRGFPQNPQPVGSMPPPVVNMPPPQYVPINNPPLQPVVVGSFCQTPMGRFGPGPAMIVGSPCYAQIPQGLVQGFITR